MTALSGVTSSPLSFAGTAKVAFARWQGSDRYGTAAALALGAYSGGAADVVIASGVSFPDALAAGYLSGYLHGPILLTQPGALPSSDVQALARLGAKRVHLVGGTSAVGATVAAQLAALPAAGGGKLEVTRVAGQTRYDTAAAVAQTPPVSAVGRVGNSRTALLASGANFPDALAGSAAAAGAGLPVLLTDPHTLSPQVSAAIATLGVRQVMVLGGPGAISPAIDKALAAKGIAVHRLAGADRGATAAAIAAWTTSALGFTAQRVAIARGDNAGGGVDALALGPLAGSRREPLLLTESATTAGPALLAYMTAVGPTVSAGDVAGGPSAVSPALVAQLEALASGGAPAASATLRVVITGLPAGTTGAVTVTGPGGFSRTLTGSATLAGLAPGAYRIQAQPVTGPGGTSYLPTVSSADQTLVAGASAVTTVDYFTQIPATTKPVAPSQIASVTVNGDGTTTVVTSAGAPRAAVGDVIATGIGPATPYGLLAKVSAAADSGSGQSLKTVPATLQEAVPQGEFDATADLPEQSQDSANAGATAKAAKPGPNTAATASSSPWSQNLKCGSSADLSLTGTFSASLRPSFQAHWSLGDTSATATVDAQMSASFTAALSGAGSCTLAPTPLGPERTLTPIEVMIGPIPLVVVPRLGFSVQGTASAKATLSITEGVSVQASAGLAYDNGAVNPVGSVTTSATFQPPVVNGTAQVTPSVSAKLTLALYGLAGPEINIDPGLDFKADITANPWWTVDGTLKAGAALRVPALHIDAADDHVIDKRFPITEAAGPFPPLAVTEFPAHGTGTTEPVLGPDGRLWLVAVDQIDGSTMLEAIDPHTQAMQAYVLKSPKDGTTIPLYDTVAFDGQGNVWLAAADTTASNSMAALVRFTPSSGLVTEYPPPDECVSTVLGVFLASANDGYVWLTCTNVAYRTADFYRFSSSGTLSAPILPPIGTAAVGELVPGADGTMWTTRSTTSSGYNGLIQLTTTGTINYFNDPSPEPFGMTSGERAVGNGTTIVEVVGCQDSGVDELCYQRVAADGTRTRLAALPLPSAIGDGLFNPALDSSGNLWIPVTGTTGGVTSTGQALYEVGSDGTTASHPFSLSAEHGQLNPTRYGAPPVTSDGAIWIEESGNGDVLRIVP